MKKILNVLMVIAITVFTSYTYVVHAASGPVKVNMMCGGIFGPCPIIVFYDRSYPAAGSRQLAVYAPNQPVQYDPEHPNYLCSYNTRTQWRIGHPKDGVSGFSATDWQDINKIKAKPAVASNWRWGDCCNSDPYDEICLN